MQNNFILHDLTNFFTDSFILNPVSKLYHAKDLSGSSLLEDTIKFVQPYETNAYYYFRYYIYYVTIIRKYLRITFPEYGKVKIGVHTSYTDLQIGGSRRYDSDALDVRSAARLTIKQFAIDQITHQNKSNSRTYHKYDTSGYDTPWDNATSNLCEKSAAAHLLNLTDFSEPFVIYTDSISSLRDFLDEMSTISNIPRTNYIQIRLHTSMRKDATSGACLYYPPHIPLLEDLFHSVYTVNPCVPADDLNRYKFYTTDQLEADVKFGREHQIHLF